MVKPNGRNLCCDLCPVCNLSSVRTQDENALAHTATLFELIHLVVVVFTRPRPVTRSRSRSPAYPAPRSPLAAALRLSRPLALQMHFYMVP